MSTSYPNPLITTPGEPSGMALANLDPSRVDHWHQSLADSLAQLVDERRQVASAEREQRWREALAHPGQLGSFQEKFRREIKALLGWPLEPAAAAPAEAVTSIEPVGIFDGIRVDRLLFEVAAGFQSYALVARPMDDAPRPLLLLQHGGWGSPEQVLGLEGESNYHDFARRALDAGWLLVLPQLPLWQKKFTPHLDQFRLDQDLKQVGGSRVALDVLTVQRAAEAASTQYPVTPGEWSIAGLSYGGFYALLTAALDVRFRSVLSSCYVNDRTRYNWTDWVWLNSSAILDDALLALMVCPRPLWVEVGRKDEIFDTGSARPILEKIFSGYASMQAEAHVVIHEFEGGHEFAPGSQGLAFLRGRKADSNSSSRFLE